MSRKINQNNILQKKRNFFSACPGKGKGFVLTLELLLILTILGIGLIAGFVVIRDAVFKYYVSTQSQEAFVSDANGTVLGKAVGFDEHDAPQMFYIDRNLSQPYRVLIGVRDDRFTSREPVYYTLPNCQGDPCMKGLSAEAVDNRGVDGLPGTGSVSYLNALQGGPNYAIGRSPDGIKGYLFRSTTQSCPISSSGAVLGSRYISQKVEIGEPCESPFPLPTAVTTVPVACGTTTTNTGGGGLITDVGDAAGIPLGGDGTTSTSCSCPAGYYDAGSAICCPDGSVVDNSGGGLVCAAGGLRTADSVEDPNDLTRNALDRFASPFTINQPTNADSDSWTYIPADGE